MNTLSQAQLETIQAAQSMDNLDTNTATQLQDIYTHLTGEGFPKVGCLCKQSNKNKVKQIFFQWYQPA